VYLPITKIIIRTHSFDIHLVVGVANKKGGIYK